MFLQKDKRRTVENIFVKVVTPEICLIFLQFRKYGQDKVVIVKDGHGLLCSSVNTNAV